MIPNPFPKQEHEARILYVVHIDATHVSANSVSQILLLARKGKHLNTVAYFCLYTVIRNMSICVDIFHLSLNNKFASCTD